MAPKKSKKISLNEFLGDSTLGSWADEMEALPNAPAARTEDDQPGQRFGRRDDFLTSRPDRQHVTIREDIPLPDQPPYTAFVGNLAFDLSELELEQFFSFSKIKSVKIIKDKDDKPKGFGYVEFEELEGLKYALTKTGSNFSGRVIRVSVAEPPKERSGYSGLAEDNSKFDNPWRREGPLPTRDSSRRRYDTPPERQPPSLADEAGDWRSNRPQRLPEPEPLPYKRKSAGFVSSDPQVNAADKGDVWTIGSKFKPDGSNEDVHSKVSSSRGRSDMGPPKESLKDESDWRSSARPRPTRSSVSPSNSTPPTPQLARKKLELLPRSGNASVTPSPLSSPKMGSTPTSGHARLNPFGVAKPVDVSSREKEVADRLERGKEAQHERFTISRTTSRTGIERNHTNRSQTPPSSSAVPDIKPPSSRTSGPNVAPKVRPTLSFANAAAKREPISKEADGKNDKSDTHDDHAQVSQSVTKVVP